MVRTVWNIVVILAALAFLAGLFLLWRLGIILRELFGDILKSAAQATVYIVFGIFGVWRAFGNLRRHDPSH
jgi:uncharacterized membrane protein YuzA (DUF378 family)